MTSISEYKGVLQKYLAEKGYPVEVLLPKKHSDLSINLIKLSKEKGVPINELHKEIKKLQELDDFPEFIERVE